MEDAEIAEATSTAPMTSGLNRTAVHGCLCFCSPGLLSRSGRLHYLPRHAGNFFPLLNGGDGPILYCFIFLLFFVAGPGRWSVDAKVTESSSKVYDAGRDQFPQRAASAGR
jgi:hypothetical protein